MCVLVLLDEKKPFQYQGSYQSAVGSAFTASYQ